MSIEDIEARRAARKEALREQSDAQRAIDLEALDAAEVEYGDNAVGCVKVPYTPGLPAMVVVKTPSRAVAKRYRDRVRPKKNGQIPDNQAAAIEVCKSCLVYPERDVFEQMLEARPGLDTQAGLLALELAVGSEESEGKG